MSRKQEEAASRRVARLKRSPEEQLALLDRRLGKGVGAAKERERLQKSIAKRPAEPQDCQEESDDNAAVTANKTSSRQRKNKVKRRMK